MATNYTKTDNFSLNLYGDSDPADLRDGYNNSMRVIDDTLEKHLNRIETLEATDTHDAEVLKALGADSVDNATAAKTKWDQAASDASTALTDATDNNGLLTALGADTTDHAIAAKTKWDQAASDASTAKNNATTNNGLLAALGADTTDHATAAKTKWDQAASDASTATNALAKIMQTISITKGHLVTFGDSYGTNTDKNKEWPTVLNARLGEDSILHNYCVAGAGYIEPNTTFQSELDTAKADKTFDHNTVGLVVIAGSRNTNDGYSGSLKTAAAAFYNNVRQEFSNARILVIPMLWDWTPVSNYWRYNASSCIEAAREVGVESIPWAWTWNLGNSDFFASGDIHPNEAGTTTIVSYILDYLKHSYTGRSESWTWRDSTGTKALFTINASGGLLTFGWHLASNVTASDYTSIKNALPKWAERSTDATNEPDAWALMASNGANDATLFKINSSSDHISGTIGIQPYTTTGSHGSPNGLMGGSFTTAW